MSDEQREAAFEALRDHVEAANSGPTETVDLSRELLIICGDDGQQVAYRGTCPKCGGTHWVPAGKVTLAHLRELGEDTLREIRRVLGVESPDEGGA